MKEQIFINYLMILNSLHWINVCLVSIFVKLVLSFVKKVCKILKGFSRTHKVYPYNKQIDNWKKDKSYDIFYWNNIPRGNEFSNSSDNEDF